MSNRSLLHPVPNPALVQVRQAWREAP